MPGLEPLQGLPDPLAHLPVKEEPVHFGKERILALHETIRVVEADLTVEGVIVHQDEHRDQQQGCQQSDGGGGAQPGGAAVQIPVHEIHAPAAAQERGDEGEGHQQQDRRRHLDRGQAGTQEPQHTFAEALVDGEGDQRGLLALAVHALHHVLPDLHVKALLAVFLRRFLHLRPDGEVLLVPHKGVGGFLGVDADVEVVKGQAHEDQGEDEPYDHQQDRPAVGGSEVGMSHYSSSFRMTVIIYTPAHAQRIRKPITDSAVAGPFFLS